MALSVNWLTKVITVPQADLVPLGGNSYSLDVDSFRLELKDIEDSADGMAFPFTHNHVAPITVGGTVLARVVELVNGYTVTFQDVGSPYSVQLDGANNNIADVVNLNNVSVRSQNSGGLVQLDVTATGIAQAVSDIVIEPGFGLVETLRLILASLGGKVSGAGSATITIRDINDIKNRIVATVDSNGNRTAVTHDASG